MENVYVWDQAFYNIDCFPDRFKVSNESAPQELTHYTTKFSGDIQQQLNLDDPKF